MSNNAIQAELAALTAANIITTEQRVALSERYPVGRWDVLMLVRAFTLLGAVSVAAGIVIIAPRVFNAQALIDFALSAGIAGGIYAAFAIRTRLPRSAAALELLSSFCVQGLSAALAVQFSTGSDNWPALVGVQSVLLAVMAYALRNRLVLINALICAFTFFGGETGYMSGWGAYWLGMNYPLRFLLAGSVSCGIALAHYRMLTGPWQGFSRVYAHWGLLVIHLALWFFALFGFFDGDVHWSGNTSERLVFSLLWAAFSVGSILWAPKLQLRMLSSYGLVFFIIDLYTFYFQFVVYHSSDFWFIHLLLSGGSLLMLGLRIERLKALT